MRNRSLVLLLLFSHELSMITDCSNAAFRVAIISIVDSTILGYYALCSTSIKEVDLARL